MARESWKDEVVKGLKYSLPGSGLEKWAVPLLDKEGMDKVGASVRPDLLVIAMKFAYLITCGKEHSFILADADEIQSAALQGRKFASFTRKWAEAMLRPSPAYPKCPRELYFNGMSEDGSPFRISLNDVAKLVERSVTLFRRFATNSRRGVNIPGGYFYKGIILRTPPQGKKERRMNDKKWRLAYFLSACLSGEKCPRHTRVATLMSAVLNEKVNAAQVKAILARIKAAGAEFPDPRFQFPVYPPPSEKVAAARIKAFGKACATADTSHE